MTESNSKVMASAMQSKTEIFIQKAIVIHGSKYSYFKSCYSKAKEKLIVTCFKHGDFLITPSNHLKGRGCFSCGRESSSQKQIQSAESLLSDFMKVHGDKYLYPNLNQRIKNKVEIRCQEHGLFQQDIYAHKCGQGCPRCGLNKPLRITHEEFIKECGEVHRGFYSYIDTTYTGIKNKIKILCPKHGVFYQIAEIHRDGAGCRKCSTSTNSKARTRSHVEILRLFKLKHGDRYDYKNASSDGCGKKVAIICKEHGVFLQAPGKHIAGQGCPKCSIHTPYRKSFYVDTCSKHSNSQSNLYVIKLVHGAELFYKIGITNSDIKTRFHGRNKPIYEIEVLYFINGDAGYIWDMEKKIHRMLKQHRYQPKHQFPGSKTECFRFIPESIIKVFDGMRSEKAMLLG